MGQVNHKRIVISGYYGFRNSGDEAVLHSIVSALREESERQGVSVTPVVLSANPAETARMYGVEAVHRMRPKELISAVRSAGALISGGGSLLQDVTGVKTIPYYLGVIKLAQLMGKPTYVYAQGIGPVLRRGLFGPMIRSVLRACKYVSVRDEESKELLAALGLNGKEVQVVPDPVMGLGVSARLRRSGADRGKTVGVSVRFWREDRADLDAVAVGLALLMERSDCGVTFLPFHLPSDLDASRVVAEKLLSMGFGPDRVTVHPGTEHPEDMLREVSQCAALIGMRLHSLIYAATSFIPAIGVSYDPKIDQFLRRLGDAPAGTTDSLSAETLARTTLECIRTADAWAAQRREAIERLQRDSLEPAKQIVRELRI
ncbi:polysaccharide pyruvyl transferase CsaB [Paenibacillus thermotolerans]|uniref:polysaccharide pyruvyl transferase CsaB n=1 Tax=Paenibacillus thermotolerans TaxID=3027807 RepID=UPI00236880A2|nr:MULTISPECIES: polysaccharide pyruvyl transferase CsaB [unclassified Paenibacillus]